MIIDRKIRVAVVFGGRSAEHAISCMSAGNVMRALDRDRYDVVPVGITTDGSWVLAADDPDSLQIRDGELPAVSKGASVVLSGDPAARGLILLDAVAGPSALNAVDVVFPVLHGSYGEDGTIQGLLEMTGLPYVGAGVFASAAGMDKEFTKKLLAAAGLPVGEYAVLRSGADLTESERDRLGLPVFVKPARAGSSIGITKVTSWSDLAAAVATARAVDAKVVVEAGVTGREIECGVLEGVDGGPPEASVPGEIRLVGSHDWYDFEAKYLDDACEFDVPAVLPAEDTERVREMACAAFLALSGEGLARVDFFLTGDRLVVNEINTMPGFTQISMFPRMWAASGLSYPALMDRLIVSALARHSAG
ncbi:MAG: D-alanine--D-alanine ligase [Geodermatophilaceae bacterium]|nr:D-alanine--D-alanine ligase [Geodermatophilaceae bacterium]